MVWTRDAAMKRVLQNAVVAAILLALFFMFAGEPNPGSQVSILMPRIVVPNAGAVGGIAFQGPAPFDNVVAGEKQLRTC